MGRKHATFVPAARHMAGFGNTSPKGRSRQAAPAAWTPPGTDSRSYRRKKAVALFLTLLVAAALPSLILALVLLQ